MKHLKSLILAVFTVIFALSFAACGTSGNGTDNTDGGSHITDGNGSSEDMSGGNNGGDVSDEDNGSNDGNGSSSSDNGGNQGDTSEEEPDETTEHNILVVYFSATNTTERIAGFIQDELTADIFEIVPAVLYTSADLNYNNSNSRSSRENRDDSVRPEIVGSVENMADYDVIYIGYPIWWGKAPKPVYTFLEAYDFSGKTMIPFCTSSSSGIGSNATYLQALTTGATWLSGQRFSSSSSQNAVASWISGLNY